MRVLTDPLGWFTLEIPDDWDASTDDCVTTVRNPAGSGTLFLSGARHVRGRQRSFGGADFLTRFLVSLGIPVTPEEIHSGTGPGCRIYSYEREDALGARWRYWSVTDDETALLISYACGAAETAREVST